MSTTREAEGTTTPTTPTAGAPLGTGSRDPQEQARDRVRVDAPLKVAGLAPYAYEADLEGVLFLAPVLATVATGRITAIDDTAARAVPGVRLLSLIHI